jgi:hypothetical protein
MTFKPPVFHLAQRILPELGLAPSHPFWSALAAAPLLENVTGTKPAQNGEIRGAWDASETRLLFSLEDAHPHATLTTHDAPLYTEEVVEVFLDPVGDLQGYFEIEVNPLNAVLDLLVRRIPSGLRKELRWHCEGLRTHVIRAENGWTAELSLPHASLTPEPPSPGTRWRANFTRIDRPPGTERELTAWSPTGLPLFHVPERFGVLEFLGEPDQI